jgi:hypothetical protein
MDCHDRRTLVLCSSYDTFVPIDPLGNAIASRLFMALIASSVLFHGQLAGEH